MSSHGRRMLRAALHEKQGGKCCYCRGLMSPQTVEPSVPWMVTIEHLHQKHLGGSNEPPNLRAACHGCNTYRPKGMDAVRYAMLRILLLPVWPICSNPPAHVVKTLRGLATP